jgi:hypothetical protein
MDAVPRTSGVSLNEAPMEFAPSQIFHDTYTGTASGRQVVGKWSASGRAVVGQLLASCWSAGQLLASWKVVLASCAIGKPACKKGPKSKHASKQTNKQASKQTNKQRNNC